VIGGENGIERTRREFKQKGKIRHEKEKVKRVVKMKEERFGGEREGNLSLDF
jgi:hypothetical protein